MSVVVMIPARFGSTRLPGKALADIGGRPMVVRVAERAALATGVDRVLVATDDPRISVAVTEAGAEAVMTADHHVSGTDRIAEVAAGLAADVVVNVQGDLPFLDTGYVEAAVRGLEKAWGETGAVMSTLATPLLPEESERSQVVKVVRDRQGDALYFSRSRIPSGDAPGLRHIGLYAYRRDFLLELAQMDPSPLEQAEKLEQLRVLENGYRIRVEVVEASESMIEVDTPEDLERARQWAARLGGAGGADGEREAGARGTAPRGQHG